MNMQDFYKCLSVKPTETYQRRLAGLTRVSRSQVLGATSELTWLLWKAEAVSN